MRSALLVGSLALLLGCDRAPALPPPPKPLPTASSLPPSANPSAAAPPSPSPPPPSAPRAVDRAALAKLEAEAKSTDSAALIVIHAGEVLADWSSGTDRGPIQTMSITKSVLALLVGCLVDRGKLSLERPVHELFPAWTSERQRRVSVLHLLSHSSGLEEGERTHEIYASKSFVQHALSSPLVHDPGTHYEYGNRASNLLAAVIARAGGKRTDEIARECLFEPLGIRRWSWSRDRAGDAHGLAGLHLLPRDLARIGELVVARGQWQGRRIVSEELIRRVTEEPAAVQPQHKRLALLWWRLPAWTERSIDAGVIERWQGAGVSGALIEQLRPLAGVAYRSPIAFVRALREKTGDPKLRAIETEIWKRKLPDARYRFGPIVGSYAAGSLGQYLVIVPEERLVAVRMRRAPKDSAAREDLDQSFPDFPDRVLALLAPPL